MATVYSALLKSLTPPQLVQPAEYDGSIYIYHILINLSHHQTRPRIQMEVLRLPARAYVLPNVINLPMLRHPSSVERTT